VPGRDAIRLCGAGTRIEIFSVRGKDKIAPAIGRVIEQIQNGQTF
jgi:hypothetical protein